MIHLPVGAELERLQRFWAPSPHVATLERRRYYRPENGTTPTVDAVVVRPVDGSSPSGYVVFYEQLGSPISAQAVLAWWKRTIGAARDGGKR